MIERVSILARPTAKIVIVRCSKNREELKRIKISAAKAKVQFQLNVAPFQKTTLRNRSNDQTVEGGRATRAL